MENDVREVIIIGSGPAGYTAALYTSRANLQPLVLAGYLSGGQLMITTDVENYPGFVDGILGPDLMDVFKRQAERFGAEVVPVDVDRVDFSQQPFVVEAAGKTYRGKTVIVATGASAKWLGVPGEEKLTGHGVSGCATCDGFFFKGQDLAVIGGGDTALEEATFLTRFATSVNVIHRRDELRASKAMQQRAFENPKISFTWDTDVVEFVGNGKLEALRLRNVKTGEETLKTYGGAFVAIGHQPNTKLFEGQLELDEKGYVAMPDPGSTITNIPGVFAAGDVRDHVYRQAVTAAGDGCRAAIDAERWLEEHKDTQVDRSGEMYAMAPQRADER
ncbi:MAG TPA: thioredoxin-disulfide reductase [Chloroflexota bacterium]|nr:thioredoxin-disulfide reductase [Chloroflexota bacterium]